LLKSNKDSSYFGTLELGNVYVCLLLHFNGKLNLADYNGNFPSIVTFNSYRKSNYKQFMVKLLKNCNFNKKDAINYIISQFIAGKDGIWDMMDCSIYNEYIERTSMGLTKLVQMDIEKFQATSTIKSLSELFLLGQISIETLAVLFGGIGTINSIPLINNVILLENYLKWQRIATRYWLLFDSSLISNLTSIINSYILYYPTINIRW
jgi:hypothetical protein